MIKLPIVSCLLFSLLAGRDGHRSAPACTVVFHIDNASIDVEGTLHVTTFEIKFDPDALDKSSITADADPSTIQTGITIRDKHLKRSDYFDVDEYPSVFLRSRSFQKIKKNTFAGEFNLTIKNITKPVMIVFTVMPDQASVRYHGTFEIDRLDFDLGERSLILDNNVKVVLDAVVEK